MSTLKVEQLDYKNLSIQNQRPNCFQKAVVADYGTYYIGVGVDNIADNIYLDFPKNREGFGGATLEFKLENGEVDKVKGPWHTNAGDLLKNTGLDFTDRHLVTVVVAKYVDCTNFKAVDVKYIKRHILSSVERESKQVRELATKENTSYYCWIFTSGGGHGGFQYPSNWTKDQVKEYQEKEVIPLFELTKTQKN